MSDVVHESFIDHFVPSLVRNAVDIMLKILLYRGRFWLASASIFCSLILLNSAFSWPKWHSDGDVDVGSLHFL